MNSFSSFQTFFFCAAMVEFIESWMEEDGQCLNHINEMM